MPYPCPGAPCCDCFICVTCQGNCADCDGQGTFIPLPGVTLTLTDPNGNPVKPSPITTDATGKFCWTIGGVVTGTYTITATWVNGQTLAKTVDVTICQRYNVNFTFLQHVQGFVLGCANNPIPGASVVCGGASTTTDAQGHFCLDFAAGIPAPDGGLPIPSPPVTVALPTGPEQTNFAVETDPGPIIPCTYQFCFVDKFCVQVNGCGGLPLPGAMATITNSFAGETLSGTTDGSGMACFVPTTNWAGSNWTLNASKAGFASNSTTGQFNGCIMTPCLATIALAADADHACCGVCADVLPKTLTANTEFGAIPLTFSLIGPFPPNICSWQACLEINPTGVFSEFVFPSFVCSAVKTKPLNVFILLTNSGGFPNPPWFLTVVWPERPCNGVDKGWNADALCSQIITGAVATNQCQYTIVPDDCSLPVMLTATCPVPGSNPFTSPIVITE